MPEQSDVSAESVLVDSAPSGHVGGTDFRDRWAYVTGPVADRLPQPSHRSTRPEVYEPGHAVCRWCGVGLDLCELSLSLCGELERREAL